MLYIDVQIYNIIDTLEQNTPTTMRLNSNPLFSDFLRICSCIVSNPTYPSRRVLKFPQRVVSLNISPIISRKSANAIVG